MYDFFPPFLKVVDEYNRRELEIKNLEKEFEEKTAALNAYKQNISEVQRSHIPLVIVVI